MTNNKQQTAVQWFLIECGKYGDTAQIPDEVIEQAKEMEKQQIIKAWWNGNTALIEQTPKQYYNETYGGNK
jgi:3-methyladenine DNA glycosylase AlkD